MTTIQQFGLQQQAKTETIKLFAILGCTRFADDEDSIGDAHLRPFGFYTHKKKAFVCCVEDGAITFITEGDAGNWLAENKTVANNKIIPVTL